MAQKKGSIRSSNIKFYFLVIMGIGFGVWGGCLPPGGIISSSFLIMIAQLFILAAAVIGLDIKFNLKEMIFDSDNSDEEKKDNKNDNN